MKKLLATLALAPMTLAACGGTTAPKAPTKGTAAQAAVGKEFQEKITEADTRIKAGFSATTRSLRNTDAINSCTMTVDATNNGQVLFKGKTMSQGKVRYEENTAFEFNDAELGNVTYPATKEYIDEATLVQADGGINDDGFMQMVDGHPTFMFLSQEYIDSPLVNPFPPGMTEEQGDAIRPFPSSSVGKWGQINRANTEESRAHSAGTTCDSFTKTVMNIVDEIKAETEGLDIYMDKVDSEANIVYSVAETGTDNKLEVTFDKTLDLPTKIELGGTDEEGTFLMTMMISDWNATVVTLPDPANVIMSN